MQHSEAFVRPVLEYASPVTCNKIKAPEKGWEAGSKMAETGLRRPTCVDTMRKQLQWPTLEQRRKQAHLTTFCKFHRHGLIHIESKHCPSQTENHPAYSRPHPWHSIPPHPAAYRQKTFFPRTIPEWNSLPPQEVSTAPTPGSFVTRVRSFLDL